jgi:hypothetical protein
MNITIKQKKLIFIVLASSLIIFIFVFGINIYYEENKLPTEPKDDQSLTDEMMEKARLESNICSSDKLENQYRVCCAIKEGIKKDLLYDCTSQKFFEPGQDVYIAFDASKFDISYDPYFLRIYSDLNNGENKYIFDTIPDALDKEKTFFVTISGTVSQEIQSFTLLKLSVYPDDTFNKKNEQVILNHEAKIFKE